MSKWLSRQAHVPHGHEVRAWLGILGILLGIARLTELGRSATSSYVAAELLGLALLCGGLLLLLTVERRITLVGRLAAAGATGCFAFVAGSVWGSTAFVLYAWCAATCIAEAASRRADVY